MLVPLYVCPRICVSSVVLVLVAVQLNLLQRVGRPLLLCIGHRLAILLVKLEAEAFKFPAVHVAALLAKT